jgi:hypothetical protein
MLGKLKKFKLYIPIVSVLLALAATGKATNADISTNSDSLVVDATSANDYVSGTDGWKLKANWYVNSSYTSSVTSSLESSDIYSLVVDYNNSKLSSSIKAGDFKIKVLAPYDTYTGSVFGDNVYYPVNTLTDNNFTGTYADDYSYTLEASNTSYTSGNAAIGTLSFSFEPASGITRDMKFLRMANYMKDRTYSFTVQLLIGDSVYATQDVSFQVDRENVDYSTRAFYTHKASIDSLPEGDYTNKTIFYLYGLLGEDSSSVHGALNYSLLYKNKGAASTGNTLGYGAIYGLNDVSLYEQYAPEVTITGLDGDDFIYYNDTKYTVNNGIITVKLVSNSNSTFKYLVPNLYICSSTVSSSLKLGVKVTGCYLGYDTMSSRSTLYDKTLTVDTSKYVFTGEGSIQFWNYSSSTRAINTNSIGYANQKGITTTYTGVPYDVEIGMDSMYGLDQDGTQVQLNNTEYAIKGVYFADAYIVTDAKRTAIKLHTNNTSDYNFEIYVKYADSSNYILWLDENWNTSTEHTGLKYIALSSSEDIVAVKFKLIGLSKSLSSSFGVGVDAQLKKELLEDSKVYFSYYADMYKTGTDDSLLANITSLNFENTELTKLVMQYDMTTYGKYRFRSLADTTYVTNILDASLSVGLYGILHADYYDPFESISYIDTATGSLNVPVSTAFSLDLRKSKSNYIKHLYLYYAIPEDFSVNMAGIEFLNSGISYMYAGNNDKIYLRDGTIVNKDTISNYITYKVYNQDSFNYLIVDFDFSENPIDTAKCTEVIAIGDISFTLSADSQVLKDIVQDNKVNINIDTYLSLVEDIPDTKYSTLGAEGNFVEEPFDVAGDGLTNYIAAKKTYNTSISYSYSTQINSLLLSTGTQTLGYATQSTTNKDSNYTFKIIGETSGVEMTDVALYTYFNTSSKNDWTGTFSSVDTSALKSAGYSPKIYYTTSDSPGLLSDSSNKWDTYSESVTKSEIKGIAIKLNNSSGTSANVAAGNSFYALINMTSPSKPKGQYTYATGFIDWKPTVASDIKGLSTNEAAVEMFADDIEKEYTLTTSITNGTITPTTCVVQAGDTKTVTFTPKSGYYVSSVKVDNVEQIATITNNTLAFTNIDANHTVDVTCEPYFSVITAKTGSGTVTESDAELKSGDSKTIEYTPASGYYVSSVKVDGVLVDLSKYPNSYKLDNITENHTVDIVFTEYLGIQATITGGTITSNTSNITSGSSATVEYIPQDENYYLDSVTVDGAAVDKNTYANAYTFTNITEGHTIDIVYKKYVSIITDVKNGQITPSIYNQKQGTNHDITYSADEGYYIASIKVNTKDIPINEDSNTYTFTNITEDQTITVECLPYYAVNTEATNGKITESSSQCEGTGIYTVMIEPDENCYLLSATLDGTDITATLKDTEQDTVAISIENSNHQLKVIYEPFKTITTKVKNGTITDTVTKVRKGDTVQVTYAPNTDSYLNSVVVDGKPVEIASDLTDNTASGILSENILEVNAAEDTQAMTATYNSSYTFENITENHTINVEYLPYLTVDTASTNGQITDTNTKLHFGDDYTVTYEPNEDYYLDSLQIDGEDVSVDSYTNGYTFQNLDASHTITADYIQYLHLNVLTQNCDVEASNTNTIKRGEYVTLTITPKDGFVFQSVYYDGMEQDITPTNNQIVIDNMQADMQVEIIYKDIVTKETLEPLAPVLASQSKKGTGVSESITPLVLSASAAGILALEKRKKKKQTK